VVTALAEVAAYVPPQRVPIESLAPELGLSPMQVKLFRRYHGLAEVSRDSGRSLLELLTCAAGQLNGLRGQRERVRYVLYARSMPVVAPFPLNPLHELSERLRLGHAIAFTVTHQACATSLLAIHLAGRLLAADDDPDALALVVAGEKAYTRVAQIVPETSLFAEASAACLVSQGGPRDRLLAYAVQSRGEFDGDPAEQPGLLAKFQSAYPAMFAEVIAAAVAEAGLRLSDVSLILPHNVNLVSWRRVCREMDFPVAKVLLDNVPSVGHGFCADAFINYRTAVTRGLLGAGDHYVIAAAGAALGATFSAMVFQHLLNGHQEEVGK
jgi:3-oxoacyl-[acyl-carrier-protein] synthase-3